MFTSVVAIDGLSDGELRGRLGLLARARARLAALDAEAVAELARRDGEAGAAEFLRDGLLRARSGAKRDVLFASRLAVLPATAAALAAGMIGEPHARLIAEAAGEVDVDEATLVGAAQREHVDLFRRTVRDHVNARIGDDLTERRRRQRARREVRFGRQADGMFTLFGRFDPVAGSRIEVALTAAAGKLWRNEDPKSRPTPAQRLADALESLVARGEGQGVAAAQGVDLLIVADYDAVAGQLADPRLADGTPLAHEEFLRLACDARILPALFDRKGQPLWLGRGRRHATKGQRAVLTERDKGCIGCGASPNWCQVHHIVHWKDGGTTDIDNLCLLCSHCHHYLVHNKGAEVVRGADGGYRLELPTGHRPRPPPREVSRGTGDGARHCERFHGASVTASATARGFTGHR